MSFDLIIRNGVIVDGSGLPRYVADVGISDGLIASIGKLNEPAKQEIDAEGRVVAPGFIDAHTHMDAQIFWDPLGTCSCWHGITTVIMGNCGFSLAPCSEENKALVVRNLERAEDISGKAMELGIKWSWSNFSEYLDAVEKTPKGINYGAYVGHSALRTFAMGERAFNETANADDIKIMTDELASALRAGAIGFSTSRSENHMTSDGKPVASRLADWDEVCTLVRVMQTEGHGIFELAREDTKRDPAKRQDYLKRVRTLAIDTKVPFTFSGTYSRRLPNLWRDFYNLVDDIVAGGGKALIQAHSRWAVALISFETHTPYDTADLWQEMRKLPLAEQAAMLRNPEKREKLKTAALEHSKRHEAATGPGTEVRPNVDYEWVFPLLSMKTMAPPIKSVAQLARESGKDPFDVFIDMALEKDLKQFFMTPGFNEDQDVVLSMIRHPHAAVTFSDSGAHVSQIMDSSMQTHMLSYWVRNRREFTLEQAIRKMTWDVATFWGLKKRGALRTGYIADVVIFDPDTIQADMPTVENDLPGGETRLKQKSSGILATIVNGQILMKNNEHTGALPGRLIRASA